MPDTPAILYTVMIIAANGSIRFVCMYPDKAYHYPLTPCIWEACNFRDKAEAQTFADKFPKSVVVGIEDFEAVGNAAVDRALYS